MSHVTSEFVKQKLADIFKNVATDGSNIKDEDDSDDAYGSGGFNEGKSPVTFEERVSEMSEKLKSAPPVIQLKTPETASAEPLGFVPAKGDTPAAPKVTAEAPKDAEALLVSSCNLPAKHAFDVCDEVATMREEATAEPKIPAPAKDIPDTVPESPVVPEVQEPTVIAEQVKSDAEMVDEVSIIDADNKDVVADTTEETNVSEEVVKHDGFVSVKEIIWKLTPPDKANAACRELYADKTNFLKYALPGGMLDRESLMKELYTAQVHPDVSSQNSDDIYEKIQEIQGWRNRVVELTLKVEEHYYIWKRRIEMYRGQAAQLEGAKGATVAAAAKKHLSDFEDYWSLLERLQHACEFVLNNLKAAYESVSRQLSILLELKKAQHDGTRFEYREREREKIREMANPVVKNVSDKELESFDGLDTAHTPPVQKDKAAAASAWVSV